MEMHPATLWEALSDAVPDRPALIQGPTRRSWRQFDDRAARLAGACSAAGVGAGSKVGQLLYNAPEFLEVYFAALKIRAVPFNVNYRYTAPEVAYLLTNADAEVLVYHASLAPVVAEAVAAARADGLALKLLVEVDDDHLDAGTGAGTGGPVSFDRDPAALAYEDVVAGAEPAPRIPREGDDVTMIYTGGTTGMPKGVITRVGPVLEGLLATVPALIGRPAVAIDDAPAFSAGLDGTPDVLVSLPASPLMHNTGLAMGATPILAMGGTVVMLDRRRFDADHLWDTVAVEGVTTVTVVGDPFARPMLAALDREPSRAHDLAGVRMISSAGAMFSHDVKAGLLRHLPGCTILDLLGASEGAMGTSFETAATIAETARFHLSPGVIVIDHRDRAIEAGSEVEGLIALPGGAEGYYKDEAKTAATFRVIDGVRYTIPGDHAVVNADGTVTLLGRGSQCINTAGEKVFPEEVEEVLKAQPGVEDALVFGVDDERFGQRVAGVISFAPDSARTGGPTLDDVLAGARRQLASYKVPRDVAVVDAVPRTDVGKADYPTARELLARSR